MMIARTLQDILQAGYISYGKCFYTTRHAENSGFWLYEKENLVLAFIGMEKQFLSKLFF